MSTVTVLAPKAAAYWSVQVGSGASYTSDAYGVIAGVTQASRDLADLVNLGCTFADSTFAITAGASLGQNSEIRESGNIAVTVNAAGQGNAADTTDDVLLIIPVPANVFDIAGRELIIEAAGKFAANTHNKEVKIWVGPTAQTVGAAIASSGMTAIADSGVVTTNAGGWNACVNVAKYGAAGSNTQLAFGAQIAAGAAHLGTAAPAALTLAENAAFNIVVTGASGTTGAANDVLGQFMSANFSN